MSIIFNFLKSALFSKYIVAIAIFIIYSALLSWHWFGVGVETEKQRNQIEWAKQVEQTRISGELLRKHEYDLRETHAEEMLNAQENIDNLLDDINSGTKRVYVRTKSPCAVSKDSKAKARSDEKESRAELYPETVKRVVRIGKECDQLAIDFNYLKNLYIDLLERQKDE